MRHQQPDEPDDADRSHCCPHHGAHRHHHQGRRQLDVDAEVARLGLPERHDVERPGRRQQRHHTRGHDDCGGPQRPPGRAGQAAEQPELDGGDAGRVAGEHHEPDPGADRGAERHADEDEPARFERRRPAEAANQQRYQHPGRDATPDRASGLAGDGAQDPTQRRAGPDTEQLRVGERVPECPLEHRPGDGQAGPDRGPEQHPGHPDVPDDGIGGELGAVHRQAEPVGEDARHVAEGDHHRPHRQADDRRHQGGGRQQRSQVPAPGSEGVGRPGAAAHGPYRSFTNCCRARPTRGPRLKKNASS